MPIDVATLARHRNSVFVETGAGPCGGSRAALQLGFPRIFVVEFDPELYAKAAGRFRNNPEVEVVYGDSGEVLTDVIAPIEEPITFWLDAHGKSCDTTGNLSKKPLLRELAAIAAHPLRDKHTILIDDWDVVEHPRRAPHLTEKTVREALRAINPNFRLSRVDGLLHKKREPCWLVMVAEPEKEMSR